MKEEMIMIKKQKGITLIALVVTIVVLLILAAVSIGMLTGENGIIKKAQESNEETEQAKVEELVTLAINSLIAQNLGNKDGITPNMIAEEVNKMQNRDDVVAQKNIFPTNIVFKEEDRRVGVNLELGIENIEIAESYNGIYSVSGLEGKISPDDLFYYEIIDEAETGATELDTLPTKKAKITGIKEKYCNALKGGVEDDTTGEVYENTYYEIIYNGEKITDTLVVPYQVEIEGEMYKITEANISCKYLNEDSGRSLPKIETIIYPNTITKIEGPGTSWLNPTLETVILPENLVEIGDDMFHGTSIKSITIPKSVTTIGNEAFRSCDNLTNITIPSGVTSIGDSVFSGCSGLTSIEIPSSVTSIGENAFEWCRGLTSIEIPSSVISIKRYAFSGCTGLTSIEIPSSVTSIGSGAFDGCTGLITVNYTGTEEQWKQITIGYGNEYLTNARIICNYTGE